MLHNLALFCVVYVLAWATPGPGTAAFIARVLSQGSRGLPAFIAGFVVGDLIWLALAATGMAVLVQTAHWLFMTVKYAGALYLLFLAFRMWTAPVRPVAQKVEINNQESSLRLFAGSLAVVLGNPKAMVFFLALLPTVLDVHALTFDVYARVAVMMCVILIGILTLYAATAMSARHFLRNTRAVKWLNRGSGVAMAGAAVATAAR